MSSSRSNNSEELQTSTDDSELDDFTSLQKITPSRACWGQELLDIQTQQLEDIIDKNRSPTEHIAYVNNLVLSRSDFWSIGLGSEVNGMILSSCLKVIEKKVASMFAASSHVVATWSPPLSLNPMLHLPANATSLQWIVLPVWLPGHWNLCILKPQAREIFFLDPLCGTGWRDQSRTIPFRNLAQILAPGPWKTLTVDDLQGAPRQGFSNNCGVFVLMYAMYIVMDGRWDFAESNMKQIRRWWCLVLLKNFPMPSAEELSGSRKRRREGIKLLDKDLCTKRARVAPTASSSEGSDKTEDQELEPGNLEEDVVLKDTIQAAAWCQVQSFKDSVSLPEVLGMEGWEQRAASVQRKSHDGGDEEEAWQPFRFSFQLQTDYELFCV
ncbi:uncharacterized protein LOC130378155 [Gadus chalcogrammus]|uniref:uncharacterized protein LOC130378155 n=1 Tax=Gadus chalcogrammus TaxID=1042646 RepID=UPI0024C21372|nr:uncharacterized protein LOC130378155 [Gadus chalcogrammus]